MRKSTGKPQRRQGHAALVLAATLAWPASGSADAGEIHHWTDSDGQSHFSDQLPGQWRARARGAPAAGPDTTAGLRPGELGRLDAIGQRQAQQHVAAERRRRQARSARERAARACRERQARQRGGRSQADGKAVSRYLREHCW